MQSSVIANSAELQANRSALIFWCLFTCRVGDQYTRELINAQNM